MRSLLTLATAFAVVVGLAAAPALAGPSADVTDHFFVYKAKVSKITGEKFPKDFNITLDDAVISGADDPENFSVQKEKNLSVPGEKNAEGAPNDPDLHYLVYQVKSAKEGVGPVDSKGKFPKPAKHIKRRFETTNQLGTLNVDSNKVAFLWVPTGKDVGAPPADPGDATHYLCYQVKESKIPPFGTQQDPSKGKLLKGLQAFFVDQFQAIDCATDKNGDPSFPATSVAGNCLHDLKKVKFLCNPASKANVDPPRVTVASVTGSTPSTTDSLMCYQAKPTAKVTDATTGAIAGLSVGDKLKQNKHTKRNNVFTTVTNNFAIPSQVDTKGEDLLCIPTTVDSVSAL